MTLVAPDAPTAPLARRAMPGRRRLGTLLASVALAAAATVALPQTADATVFGCMEGNQSICATVTAIRPGSALLVHRQPNYSGGVVAGSPRMTNGDWFIINCWTRGAGDADGHGDRYWFRGGSDRGSATGYVNDWYLTTGSYAQWSRYVRHC
jgi:hypothetical protein